MQENIRERSSRSDTSLQRKGPGACEEGFENVNRKYPKRAI
jgi:hypothetical protein